MELVKSLEEIRKIEFFKELISELQNEKVAEVSEEWGYHKTVIKFESGKVIKIPDEFEGLCYLQVFK